MCVRACVRACVRVCVCVCACACVFVLYLKLSVLQYRAANTEATMIVAFFTLEVVCFTVSCRYTKATMIFVSSCVFLCVFSFFFFLVLEVVCFTISYRNTEATMI